MGAHGLDVDGQGVAHLLVGSTVHQQAQNVALALGQVDAGGPAATVRGAEATHDFQDGAGHRCRAAVAGLGSKLGIDATNKWAGETARRWGRPIVMDAQIRRKVDALWPQLGL